MKIVTAGQMRDIDRKAAESGIATAFLMENAGKCVADETKNHVANVVGKIVLVISGPGNNGGDALVAARYLHDWGADLNIYLLSERSAEDNNLKLAKKRDIPILYADKDARLGKFKQALSSAEIVIDGILGTGKARRLEGTFKDILSAVNREKQKRPALVTVAVDIPTGLDADSGAIDPNCLHADLTVTLGLPKPGLYNFPGADRAGKVIIVDIGIPNEFSKGITTELITDKWAKSALPQRPAGANKGTFGRLLVVAGSENYIGAAYLACMGAARVGAGVVTLSTASSLQPILASKLTEVTYAPLPESGKGLASANAAGAILSILSYYRVLLMGCGLGQRDATKAFLKKILFDLPQKPPTLILDADALNLLSDIKNWWRKLPDNTILTPHAGEMARLLDTTIQEVQGNRLETARKAASAWKKVVVLKGAYTVIAEPGGLAGICDIANAGLATAGTGDVLAGAIAGLAAQGLPSFDAACLGVYLHAQAAEIVKDELGDAGMLASDLLPALPRAIKNLKGK